MGEFQLNMSSADCLNGFPSRKLFAGWLVGVINRWVQWLLGDIEWKIFLLEAFVILDSLVCVCCCFLSAIPPVLSLSLPLPPSPNSGACSSELTAPSSGQDVSSWGQQRGGEGGGGGCQV